jgi:hypothetical protein
LNSPKEDLAIQLRVWRRYAVIAVPFWHRGAEAERVFAQLLDYLKVIRSAAGYFAYDRQAGLAFDPIATEMLQSSQYVSVLEVVHNQKTMTLLWNPESWSQRLAELEARSGDLKEAPLRRDVRSLGTLLGEVLREQAGEDLFAHVEALRQGTIRRRDAEARGQDEEAARHAAKALELVHSLPVERAILLTRAFAFYFELINLAETNHRKRRRIALRLSGEAGRQRGSLAGTLCEMRRVGISAEKRWTGSSACSSCPSLRRILLRQRAVR